MLSDTLTIALVIVLLFGSIVLYLYTCIQQNEQKVSLLESILLDLKMSTEVKAYTELPIESLSMSSSSVTPTAKDDSYTPFEDDEDLEELNEPKTAETLPADEVIDMDDYKNVIAEAVSDAPSSEDASAVNYELMSLKELQVLAKSRGIVGVTKKAPLIEALKTSDRISTVTPSSLQAVGSNSFLESSASVSDETA
jgi:hypothetical protein